MNAIVQPSEIEMALSAHNRRVDFHRRIAARAAALVAPKPPAPAVESVAPPARPDDPATSRARYTFKEFWFQIVDVTACPSLSLRQIKQVVCDHFGLRMADMVTARRTKEIVRPRQIAMFLCKEYTPKTLPEIGRHFGGRDHTTVLHACRKVAALKLSDPAIVRHLEKIETTLKALL